MIKYLVLLFNLIGLFVYQLFMQSNVTVTQTAPPQANPGSTFTVEVTINKGGTTGFAKYQAELPQGFTATAVEKQGATVLSSGNAIKFIWASLPGDATMKISFTVSVDASVSGSQPIGGKFLYVVDNVKAESDPNPQSIMIGSGAVATNTTSTTPPSGGDNGSSTTTTSTTPPSGGDNGSSTTTTSTTPPSGGNNGQSTTTSTTPPTGGDNGSSTTTTSTTPPSGGNSGQSTTTSTTPPTGGDNGSSTTTTSTTPPSGGNSGQSTTTSTTPPSGGDAGQSTTAVSAPSEPPLKGVSATRSMSTGTVAPGGSITVSVTVHKGNLSGFAKLQEILPAGFTATEGEKKTASFTLVDNKMKMVWLSLPADSVFTVTYQLVAGPSAASGSQSVTGTFSFVADGGANSYKINATTFTVGGAGAVVVNNGGSNGGAQTNGGSQSNGGSQTNGGSQSNGGSQTNGGTTTTAGTHHTSGGSQTSGGSDNGSMTSHIPSATGPGVSYFVQVMALHAMRSTSFVKGFFKLAEQVDLRSEDGLNKYLITSKYKVYKDAHDKRDAVRPKVTDAFVVAYNTGKRITVQEALMITSQQWYQ